MNTKETILYEALNLFSVRGYDAVSVRDIARAVGIKESSLYNHFSNKQDIFDSVLLEYTARTESFFHETGLTGDDRQFVADTRTVQMYKNMSNKQFSVIATQIFDQIFTDEISGKLRRLLTIEQYRNKEMGERFRHFSFDNSLDFQAELFAAMIDAGCFIKTDPYLLAMAFFSPIFLLFYKFDNDEAGRKEARRLFLLHIDHFNSVYGGTK